MIGSEGAMVPTKTPSVSSVRRALTIIETLAHARNGMGVSVVSRKIHAPKSSTHTILLTLERSGFLRRDDRTGHYSLGLKIFDLVSLCLGKTELREQTRPYLLNLVEQTGLTAHLAILDGDQVVYVDKVESPGLLKINTWVGRRIDAHCTALGKVLLAHLAAHRFDELFKSKVLARRTSRTIGSKDALKREMQRIRARGYAVDDEECGTGVRCLASAVFDHEGKAKASIGVSGTTAQVSRQKLESLGNLARDTARKISRNLGFEA
jgi:IclR family transcriptional regulator, KDG regulon repressor